MKKRKLNKFGKFIIILLILLLIGIITCIFKDNIFKSKDTKKDNFESNKKNNEIKKEEKLNIIDINSNSRPYAVMINNIKTVWGYQCGLQDAYIVYEIIVEGGYTRLMAIFKDKNLDRIGSVRSSRHYFLDYALENDAIYVHFGWSPQAEKDIKTLGVNNINFMRYNGYIRDRSLGLASEHTAFTSTDKINTGIDYYKYRKTTDTKPLLNYSASSIDLSKLDGNIVANKVYLEYSGSRYTSYIYDDINKVYKRYSRI